MIKYVTIPPEMPHGCISLRGNKKLRRHLAGNVSPDGGLVVPLGDAASLLRSTTPDLIDVMIKAGWLYRSDRNGALVLIEEAAADYLALTPFISSIKGVPHYGEAINVTGAGMVELAALFNVAVSDFYFPCLGCTGSCACDTHAEYLLNTKALS